MKEVINNSIMKNLVCLMLTGMILCALIAIVIPVKAQATPQINGSSLNLSFSSRVMNSYELPREIDVLISSDFNGKYTRSDVIAATWVSIGDKFKFSSPVNGALPTVVTPSGNVDISDLLVADKPLYIAFRYKSEGVPPSSRMSRVWRIENFLLTHETAGQSTEIAAQSSGLWTLVQDGTIDLGRGGISQTSR